jgi:hypothetical protein
MKEGEYIKELEARLAHSGQELLTLKSAVAMAGEEILRIQKAAREEPSRLRDVIAMSALQGLIAHYGVYPTGNGEEQAASEAYHFADCMMQARDIRRDSGHSD